MANLLWMVLRSPLRTLTFSYTFVTLCLLHIARRLLLPQYPVYQNLRIRLHRAFLIAAHLHYPDLVHRLPITNDPGRARKVETKDFLAYIIPGHETISSDAASRVDCKFCVVLYAHGGGYARGEARMYQRYMERWYNAAQMQGLKLIFLSVEYPLSSTASHPAQLDSFLSAYKYLLASGIPASRIVLMGDSAGAGLCILTSIELLKRSLTQPAGSVLVSPWIDHSLKAYEGGNPLIETDYVVTANSFVPAVSKMFIGGISGSSPDVNPLFKSASDIRGMNKQLLLVGGAEFVLHEDIAWADKCKDADVDCTVVKEWGQMHIYAMGSRWVEPRVRLKTDKIILDWIASSVK